MVQFTKKQDLVAGDLNVEGGTASHQVKLCSDIPSTARIPIMAGLLVQLPDSFIRAKPQSFAVK
jgi:hypothetical protein